MRSLVPLLLLSACLELPRLAEDPSLPGSVLGGTVAFEGDGAAAPTLLLLSSEDNPMPPLGVGSPVSFAGVASSSFGPVAGGVRSAPWVFTDVAPGAWYVLGVMDLDRNFHPEVTALASPTCGDLVGWHADSFIDGVPTPIAVGEQTRVDGVVIGPLLPIVEPHPSFTTDDSIPLFSGDIVRLESVSVDAEFGDPDLSTLTLSTGPVWTGQDDPCAPSFAFVRTDEDGDGAVDRSPLVPGGLFEDRWPRVLFQWQGVPTGDGYDRGDDEDNTIAVIGDPAPPGGGALPGAEEIVRTTELDVTFTGLGLRILPDGSSEIIGGDNVPAGDWSITLITRRGQLWTLPNEVADGPWNVLAPPGRLTPDDPSQGAVLSLR